MTTLALDATGDTANIALLAPDGTVTARFTTPGRPGLIETLPLLLQQAVSGIPITLFAVTIGPGSFTGLRTSIALAQGFCAAAGIPLHGIRADEAYAQAFPQLARPLWTAIRARKNRIFLIRDGVAEAFTDADLPRTRAPIAVAGSAANEVAAHLAALDGNVILTNARKLDPAWAARAARARIAAGLPPHPAQPLYIDPPEAKLPSP